MSSPSHRLVAWVWQRLPGLVLCLALAFAASQLAKVLPMVGMAISALALGILARLLLGPKPLLAAGVRYAAKPVLQLAIVLLGTKTSLGQIALVGSESLLVMLTSLASAFLTAWLVGRMLKVEPKLAALIGTGTAICGGSAIAAAAPALQADESDTAYAFSVIFAFNLVAVFIFPVLGRLAGLSASGFGLWAGTAINDTSSVVAAAYAWSPGAGDYAVIVKLARTTMIVPVTLILGALASRGVFRQTAASPAATAGTVATAGTEAGQSDAVASKPRSALAAACSRLPWFILAFLGASILRSVNIIPAALGSSLSRFAVYLIATALAAIGFSTDLKRIAATGWRPLVLGLAVWAAVAASSLLMQNVLGLM